MDPCDAFGVASWFHIVINDEPPVLMYFETRDYIPVPFKREITIPGEYIITGVRAHICRMTLSYNIVVIASDPGGVSSVSRTKTVSVTLPIKPELLYCDPVARLDPLPLKFLYLHFPIRPGDTYGCSVMMYGTDGGIEFTFSNKETITLDLPGTPSYTENN